MAGNLALLKAALCLAAFVWALLMGKLARKAAGVKRGYTVFWSMAVTGLCIWAYGMGWEALPRFFYGQALLFASEHDYATHTVPDYVPVCILATGLADLQIGPALLGMALVPLPLLVAALAKEGCIGGADIKLMGASGFVLGSSKGYLALIAGLLLAVLFEGWGRHGKNEPFALIPYLAAGCLIAGLPFG